MGLWSGLTVDELEDAFPQAWRSRLDDPFNHRPPEGESLSDMGARCAEFLDALLSGPVMNIALVTHQVMSRVILGQLLALSPEEVVEVIHPNDVFYQVNVGELRSVRHFLNGQGPFDGLLHRGDGETIPPLNRPS